MRTPFPAALVLSLLLPALPGCRHAAAVRPGVASVPVRYVDVTTQAGIHFRHTSGESGRAFTAETLGSGCAFLDYDGDGRLDLFLVNSSRLPGFHGKGPLYPALYRNLGGGKFRDVTREAGLAIDCYGMGVAVADYDNDGNPDLLLTAAPASGYSGSHLFRNDGGHFTDVTRRAGITKPAWGTSAAWFDYDRDGYLDLFICSYLDWSPQTNKVCGPSGHRYGCDPTYYAGTKSVLYHNNKDGTFTDVTERAGVASPNGKALGVVVWDIDDDGWPDFAVANDTEPNWLFHNNRDGTFSETGLEAGIAYGVRGQQRAGMGIDTADYDHSGRDSLLIGNLSGEGLALFRPIDAAGHFTDQAESAGLYQPSLPFTTFGARFLDVDRDGFPDILTANGHVRPDIQHSAGAFDYRQRLQLFHNEPAAGGGRRFQDITGAAGSALSVPRVARGLAVGDVDGNGSPDVLISTNNGSAVLLRNEGAPLGHWLAVKLIGTHSNRDGIGARVRITAGGQVQTGWVRSGGSYCSEDEHVARFGLGASTQVDRLEVRWPDGRVEQRANIAADCVLLIREGGA